MTSAKYACMKITPKDAELILAHPETLQAVNTTTHAYSQHQINIHVCK